MKLQYSLDIDPPYSLKEFVNKKLRGFEHRQRMRDQKRAREAQQRRKARTAARGPS